MAIIEIVNVVVKERVKREKRGSDMFRVGKIRCISKT